jgi:hypothetical protein
VPTCQTGPLWYPVCSYIFRAQIFGIGYFPAYALRLFSCSILGRKYALNTNPWVYRGQMKTVSIVIARPATGPNVRVSRFNN